MSNNPFIADELIKLKSLLDDGVLAQEEFDTQKARLLNYSPPALRPRQTPKIVHYLLMFLIVGAGIAIGLVAFIYLMERFY